jgi:hypothetical protein
MIPLLMLILVGLFEVGPSIINHNIIANATHQAARVASQYGASSNVSQQTADGNIVAAALSASQSLQNASVQQIDIYQPSASDGHLSASDPVDSFDGSGKQISLNFPMSSRIQTFPDQTWIAVQIKWRFRYMFAPGAIQNSTDSFHSALAMNPPIITPHPPANPAWKLLTIPSDPSYTGASYLPAVSCASPTFCEMVYPNFQNGVYQTSTTTWNGTVWSRGAPVALNSGWHLHLIAISCVSPTFCMASGVEDSAGSRMITEQFNGSAWSISGPAATTQSGTLYGISCASVGDCMAVGGSSSQTPAASYHWNGTWTKVPTSSPGAYATFYSISCVGANWCMAAGQYRSGSATLSLVEVWNGSAWSVISVPQRTSSDTIEGVACANPSWCMAVGGGGLANLPALQWNGSTWTVEPIPSPASAGQWAGQQHVRSVSCPTTSFCVASHYYTFPTSPTSGTAAPLISQFDGSNWSTPEAPRPAGTKPAYAPWASCTSATFCMVAGLQIDVSSPTGGFVFADEYS